MLHSNLDYEYIDVKSSDQLYIPQALDVLGDRGMFGPSPSVIE